MTIRERAEIKELLSTGTIMGKDGNTKAIFKREHVQAAFREAMEEIGFTEKQLATNLFDLTQAQTVRFFQSFGRVTASRRVADNGTRLQANKLIGEWFGLGIREIDVHHSGAVGGFDALSAMSDEELNDIVNAGESGPGDGTGKSQG
jgi:hypothetical protein